MKKQTVKKLTRSVIIFTFVLFFIQAVLPLKASAAIKLDWENPNKSGATPYKIKTADVINSQMITQVVGCTGITDKVSNAIVNFSKDLLTQKGRAIVKTKVCLIGQKLGVVSTSSIPYTNTPEVPKLIECNRVQQTENKTQEEIDKKALEQAEATKKREECLDGIAVTLARNQLTAMTRNTMNWINTGFNGDPMYVRDITSFTNSLEKNVIETGVVLLTDSARPFPYGYDFSRSVVNGYNSGASFRSGAGNFLNSLTSDLGNFITDPRSYYSENALQRAQYVNETFSNDFSTGGWDAWLALTQKDQNNPLGFTIKASEFLQDQQMTQTQIAKDELATNNGFLSQKKCVLWQIYKENGKPEGEIKKDAIGAEYVIPVYKESKSNTEPNFDKCIQYEVITPGSLIKDKVSTYVNSPERQLELVKTINDSLNSLFTNLIAKLTNEGLSSLGSNESSTDPVSGYGSNNDLFSNDSISLEGLGISNPTDPNSTSMGGGYSNGAFDLTRDLGNQFIHNYNPASTGAWDAKTNKTVYDPNNTELKIGLAPVNKDGNPLINVFYNVIVAGNSVIIKDGDNDWKVGDRAFWDGEEWQNWKKGTANPIKKRGILQIQKDYTVAARKFLTVLPSIMPKIGELDYCIPGPNPNWQTNSGEFEAAFTELAGTIKQGANFAGWVCPPGYRETRFGNCRDGLKTAPHIPSLKVNYSFEFPGTPAYDNYLSLFQNTYSNWWNEIKSGKYWKMFNNEKYFVFPAPAESETQKIIDGAVEKVTRDIKLFYSQFGNYISSVYGSRGLMQKQYIENENTTELKPNPNYLPIAQEGLDVTKDIVSYSEDINQTTEEYNNFIIKANANINKLEAIKKEVSKIIIDAQKRRDDALMKEEGLTYDQYLRKYKECIDEEDIAYYDDLTITKKEDGARCKDNMDNDLDGLVDTIDPDCHEFGSMCSDNIDNDGDGVKDGADTDCQ